ncbi:hypothetical protein L345_01835, partial [Ophiophagus hannah]
MPFPTAKHMNATNKYYETTNKYVSISFQKRFRHKQKQFGGGGVVSCSAASKFTHPLPQLLLLEPSRFPHLTRSSDVHTTGMTTFRILARNSGSRSSKRLMMPWVRVPKGLDSQHTLTASFKNQRSLQLIRKKTCQRWILRQKSESGLERRRAISKALEKKSKAILSSSFFAVRCGIRSSTQNLKGFAEPSGKGSLPGLPRPTAAGVVFPELSALPIGRRNTTPGRRSGRKRGCIFPERRKGDAGRCTAERKWENSCAEKEGRKGGKGGRKRKEGEERKTKKGRKEGKGRKERRQGGREGGRKEGRNRVSTQPAGRKNPWPLKNPSGSNTRCQCNRMAPKRQRKVELKVRSDASPLNRQVAAAPPLPWKFRSAFRRAGIRLLPRFLQPAVKGCEAELPSTESLGGWALCLHPRSAASEPRKASLPDPFCVDRILSIPPLCPPPSDNRTKWSLSPSSSQGSRTLRGILSLEGCVRWVAGALHPSGLIVLPQVAVDS